MFLPGGEDHEVGVENPGRVYQHPSSHPSFDPECHAIIGAERVRDGLAERGFRGLTLLVQGLGVATGRAAGVPSVLSLM